MTVAPRCSVSSRRNWSSACRESTSRSVVTSSRRRSSDGRSSLSSSCARRRCPSDTLCSRHSKSRSSKLVSRSSRALTTLCGRPSRTSESANALAMKPTEKSAWKGTPLPTHATCRVQSPESIETSVLSFVSPNASRPSTCSCPSATMCLPPISRSSVVLPAPFAPTSSEREPRATLSSTPASAARPPPEYPQRSPRIETAAEGSAAGGGGGGAGPRRRDSNSGESWSRSRCTAQKSRPHPRAACAGGATSSVASSAIGLQNSSFPLET
mmetsp:Transcript_4058/g.13031  ORF Transcript_4058/g.13031 Transcript_4058/m.13031 type:complete len:269 (-) Transcript_4058:827-1633(-)